MDRNGTQKTGTAAAYTAMGVAVSLLRSKEEVMTKERKAIIDRYQKLFSLPKNSPFKVSKAHTEEILIDLGIIEDTPSRIRAAELANQNSKAVTGIACPIQMYRSAGPSAAPIESSQEILP
jgi:hypothetical protein